MKVLVAHNFYDSSQPSGENAVVRDEVAQLRLAGVEVVELFRHSDELLQTARAEQAVRGAARHVLPRLGTSEYTDLLRRVRPDIIHVHNLSPGIGTSLLRAARNLQIPSVATMHNYRVGCLAGTHLRGCEVCTQCPDSGSALPGVIHGCYRQSRSASVAVALGRRPLRSEWRQLSQLIVLTDFMKAYVEAELPALRGKIHVKPNAVSDPPTRKPDVGKNILFVGRLDASKGIIDLLDAWVSVHPRSAGELRICGAGPLSSYVRQRVAGLSKAEFLGQQKGPAIRREMVAARALVVPSLWYEGYPRVIAEAYAHGRPVIGPTIGSLGAIISAEVGYPYEHGTSVGLSASLLSANNEVDAQRRGVRARQLYERSLSPEVVTGALLNIYAKARQA